MLTGWSIIIVIIVIIIIVIWFLYLSVSLKHGLSWFVCSGVTGLLKADEAIDPFDFSATIKSHRGRERTPAASYPCHSHLLINTAMWNNSKCSPSQLLPLLLWWQLYWPLKGLELKGFFQPRLSLAYRGAGLLARLSCKESLSQHRKTRTGLLLNCHTISPATRSIICDSWLFFFLHCHFVSLKKTRYGCIGFKLSAHTIPVQKDNLAKAFFDFQCTKQCMFKCDHNLSFHFPLALLIYSSFKFLKGAAHACKSLNCINYWQVALLSRMLKMLLVCHAELWPSWKVISNGGKIRHFNFKM